MAPSWPQPRKPCCASPLAKSSRWALEGAKNERKQLGEKYLAIRNELLRFHETFHTLVAPYVRMNQKLRWVDQYL